MNFITNMNKEKEMKMEDRNQYDESEKLFIDAPFTMDDNFITFDPATREMGKIKEMWREKEKTKKKKQKKKQKKKLKILASVFSIMLPIMFSIMFVGKIKDYIIQRQVEKCIEELRSYEMFIPNDQYFYNAEYKKMGSRDEFSANTYAEDMKAAYQIYKETMLSLKEKWNFEMICFSMMPMERKHGNYFTTYDVELTDKLLEFPFFELKDGYPFREERNEVWVLGKNKNSAPSFVDMNSSDGNMYRFDVVGKMKYNFLPMGWLPDAKIENQFMELSNGETVYLINPYCDFIRQKELACEISNAFIIFDEENKIEAKRELEQYGYFTILQ